MKNLEDSLGNRMKSYENRYCQVAIPMIPVICRLDGRSFHKFTKGLKKPFDKRLSNLMIKTTKFLVEETNAKCGYTQSDEITLVWLSENWKSEIFFDGKIQKMNSILASMTTGFFNKFLSSVIPEKKNEIPLFDCRVFQVPNINEAVNVFVWREQDAVRNSIQGATRAHYSHSECMNKNGSELQQMLWEKNVNWDDYPAFFKRGTYVRKRVIERKLKEEELSNLPPKHEAIKNPDVVTRRSVVMEENFPKLTQIINRNEVICMGADPIIG